MEPLHVTLMGFYSSENAKNHHTDDFDLVREEIAVLRRGQEFYFVVRFDRELDETVDVVRISFAFGPRPNYLKGTRVILVLDNSTSFPEDTRQWGLILDRMETRDTTLIMRARISSAAQVGRWLCGVHTNILGDPQRNDYWNHQEIYILFNPWCKDDAVYMENESELEEYIRNEHGKVWMGTYRNPKGKPWVFGQFDRVVLPVAVSLLEKSGLPHEYWGSPVYVSRAISAIINANDDNGLIVGKWAENYPDGTSPLAWTGSVAIFEEYFNSGGTPVKYGQCWVFAAATVTICRALGIPCRCITNYISAHDTNMTLTVDRFFDVFGNKIENGPDGVTSDNCWNFHVWNDVWMARPDLPPGYGGWQVIDATPQEVSHNNKYSCGPASVVAVKRGEVGYSFDTPFVFAEVNADVCHFQEDENSLWGFKKLLVDKYHVGRKIVTKDPFQNDREGDSDLLDITSLYKSPEGSEEENQAVENAKKSFPVPLPIFYDLEQNTVNDVQFDLVNVEFIPLGLSFDIVVNIYNRSNEERQVVGKIAATSVYYNGNTAHNVKKAKGMFTVGPGDREIMKIHVEPSEYADKLVDHNMMKVFALATVQETNQTWSEEDDFVISKPTLNITVPFLQVGQSAIVSLTFRNPLEIPLTNCTVIIEGSHLQRPRRSLFRDVEPRELVSIPVTIIPAFSGEKLLVANFSSNELQGVEGSLNVFVEP